MTTPVKGTKVIITSNLSAIALLTDNGFRGTMKRY